MRLIIETFQDQQHFLPFRVTQKYTEWMESNTLQWNNPTNVKHYTLKKTQNNVFGDERVWKSRWVQIIRLWELLAKSVPLSQCRIRVASVLTKFSPKSKYFSIATFGGVNQACSYGVTWVWLMRFLKIGSTFGFLDYQDCNVRKGFKTEKKSSSPP